MPLTIIPSFISAGLFQRDIAAMGRYLLYRVFMVEVLATQGLHFKTRDNFFLGITKFVPNSGQNGQAGQCGTHIAKLPPPPVAGEAICLLGKTPQTPLNSPVLGLAARSCGTLYVGPEARQDEGKVSELALENQFLSACPVRRSPSLGRHWA